MKRKRKIIALAISLGVLVLALGVFGWLSYRDKIISFAQLDVSGLPSYSSLRPSAISNKSLMVSYCVRTTEGVRLCQSGSATNTNEHVYKTLDGGGKTVDHGYLTWRVSPTNWPTACYMTGQNDKVGSSGVFESGGSDGSIANEEVGIVCHDGTAFRMVNIVLDNMLNKNRDCLKSPTPMPTSSPF